MTIQIIAPDGSERMDRVEVRGELRAFYYPFWPVPGDPLGTYYAIVNSSIGTIEYPFEVGYPMLPVVHYSCGQSIGKYTAVLTGFEPLEVVRIGVYQVATDLTAESIGSLVLVDSWVEEIDEEGFALVRVPSEYENNNMFLVVLGQVRGNDFYTSDEIDSSGWASIGCQDGS